MDKVRLGIIGCGGIMEDHVNGFVTMPDVEVVAVADLIAERREETAARFGTKLMYRDHTELYNSLKPADLDAVFIAVPPSEHKGIEEEAIARKWHFKVEKPMTLCQDQAHAISKAALDAGIVTAVGFQDRYLDLTARMKEALTSMRVGLVNGFWAGGIPMVPWWRTKATCGGQLLEQNIHLVDLLRYLFGDFASVYAVSGQGVVDAEKDCPGYDLEDYSTAVFTMKSGVVATLHSLCYLLSGGSALSNGLTIHGREQSIDYRLRNHVRFVSHGVEHCYHRLNNQITDSDRAFFDAVKKADPAGVRSPYADALKTLDACFAANQSMASGKPIVL